MSIFKKVKKFLTPETEQQRFMKHMSQAVSRSHVEMLEREWDKKNR